MTKFFVQFFLFFVLAACQSLPVNEGDAPYLQKNLLNSQRIELRFGSYGVDILKQDAQNGTRLSNLYSLKGQEKISRTIAFSRFAHMDESLKKAHEKILSGGSIGSTLKEHGFQVKKKIFYLKSLALPLQTMMHTNENSFATVIYDLNVEKDGKVLTYCTILESYHPEFLTLALAQGLYGNVEQDEAKAEKILKDFIKTLAD